MRTHAAAENAADSGAGACDVGLVDAVLDDDWRAASGLGKRRDAAYALLAFDATRLVYDEIADRRSTSTQSSEEALQVVRGAQLEVHDAMSLPVELAVKLCAFSHTDRRMRHTREINVVHQLSFEVHIVASLIDKRGEPLDITCVDKQVPTLLQGRRLVGIGAIGIRANAVVVVIVCICREKKGKKTDKKGENGLDGGCHKADCLLVLPAKIQQIIETAKQRKEKGE